MRIVLGSNGRYKRSLPSLKGNLGCCANHDFQAAHGTQFVEATHDSHEARHMFTLRGHFGSMRLPLFVVFKLSSAQNGGLAVSHRYQISPVHVLAMRPRDATGTSTVA